MKIRKHIIRMVSVILLGCILCTSLSTTQVQAASKKVITLKAGKTYSYDLNGDKKKEKIKITYIENRENYWATVKFYVNGKVAYTRKIDDTAGFPPEFKLIDLNTKDKYKEVLIHTFGSSVVTEDFFALRYYRKKKVRVFEGISSTSQINSYRFYFSSNTGKNQIYISADTPYQNMYFGSYYVKIPVLIKNKKFVVKKQSSYSVSNFANWNKHEYELKRSMKLYKSSSIKSKNLSNLRSGTKFYVLGIKPVSKYKSSGALYVKVRTTSGKKGWIYFPDYSRNNPGYLKEVPGWG